MKKVFSMFLLFSFAFALGGCAQNNDLAIPSGATFVLDANALTGASSPTGTCSVTTWPDLTSNGNNATIDCGSGGGLAGSGTTADPNRIIFNGTSTSVTTTVNAQADVMPNSTWLAWIKPTATTFSHVLSLDDHAGSFNRSLVIDNATADYGVFNRFNNTWITTPVDVGAWQFVAVGFSASDIVFHKNGTTAFFGNAPAYVVTPQTFTIGRSAGGSFDFFQGEIAWVAVYPRLLNSSEVNSACRALMSRYAGANCN